MKKITAIFLLLLLYSCKNEPSKEDLIKEKTLLASDENFNTAIALYNDSNSKINIDSLKKVYDNLKNKNIDEALKYAENLRKEALDIKFTQIETQVKVNESLDKIKKREEKEWLNSKAGKIHRKHPEWSKEDCETLSKNRVWIGMDYEMLLYLRGKPNRVNTSNYGNGNEYQCCWDDLNPSCFYMKSDNIIYTYN